MGVGDPHIGWSEWGMGGRHRQKVVGPGVVWVMMIHLEKQKPRSGSVLTMAVLPKGQ